MPGRQMSRRGLLAGLAVGAAGVAAGCGRSGSSSRAQPSTSQSGGSGQATGATASAAPTGPAVEVVNGPRDRPSVALTFHGSGEPRLAEALLRAAESGGAKVTVFAVCSWLADNPSFAGRIRGAGHGLANHTYTHPDLGKLDAAAVQSEFSRAADVLMRLTGSNGGYARPSAMDRATPLVLAAEAAAGYRTSVAYDVDPHDYQDPGADAVVRRTLAGVRPGSIVSLHLGHSGTVSALPRILTGLSQRGLRPVTVHDLLA